MDKPVASYQDAIGGDCSSSRGLNGSTSSELIVESSGSSRNGSISTKAHYCASSLDPETKQVIVTRIESSPFQFTIQVKSAAAEIILSRMSSLRELMSAVDLKPLADPKHGVPCLIIYSQVLFEVLNPRFKKYIYYIFFVSS